MAENKEELVINNTTSETKSGAADRLFFFLEQNRKPIMIGLAGIIVFFGLIGAYRYYQASQEAEAQDSIFRAQMYFEKDSLDKAIKGDGQNYGFEAIVENYGGTKAGNLAQFYLGTCYLKKYRATNNASFLDQAIESLESFDKPGGFALSAAAYGNLAFAKSEKKEYAEAAKMYETAARTFESDNVSSDYLFKAAIHYEEVKEMEVAKTLYEEIVKRFPNAPIKAQAEANLSKMAQ